MRNNLRNPRLLSVCLFAVAAQAQLTPQIATTSLPDGYTGAAYSGILSVKGGAPPYTWSVSKGQLPAGLSLGAAGTITGTPTKTGNSNFTVEVKDLLGASDTQALSIKIDPAVSITTTSLPAAIAGVAYSNKLAASGGTTPFQWSVASGSLPPGIALSSAGVLSGTPASAGSFPFTVALKDANGATDTQALTLTVAAAVSIGTTSLPGGMVGVAYSQVLTATGATGTYTWSVSAGALPAGLTLSAGGTIAGTPTKVGAANFTVMAVSGGSSATKPLMIVIATGLSVATASPIAGGTVGAAYSQTFTAQGGTPPYTFQLSGTLPAGLSFSAAAGVLSGTPAQSGTFPITLKVTDSTGAQATASFSLVVAAGLTITNPANLPTATAGVGYAASLQATGGTSPYQWVSIAGALPGGLNLTGTGTITGTPTAPGTFTFTVQATDANSNRATKQLTLVVAAGLTIATVSLPAGTLGTAYSQTLAASGGTPPYSWSVTTGSLPPGVTLQPNTGIVTGTPAAAGSFTFTLLLTDANFATASKQFTVSIGSGLQVTTADSLPGATVGTGYSATLQASGGKTPYTWGIASGALPGGLTLNASTGAISGAPAASGSFNFTVQVTDAAKNSATAALALAVGVPGLPTLSIAGFSGTVQPLQQTAVGVALSQPYPVALTGMLTLTFTPGGSHGINDPSIQFSTGGRTANFNIPANSTQATFSASQLAVQTGSVQGAITLTLTSLQAAGSPLPIPGGATQTVQVSAAAPAISSISVVQVTGGIQVEITGVADTRDLTQATVTFQPGGGTSLQSTQLTISLSSAASAWFASSSAAAYGGQFSLTLPFTFTGNVSVSSVSVVLSSSAGNSAAASASY